MDPHSSTSQAIEHSSDPFTTYSQSLYDYTFRLWKESKKAADEGNHPNAAPKGGEENKKNVVQTKNHH